MREYAFKSRIHRGSPCGKLQENGISYSCASQASANVGEQGRRDKTACLPRAGGCLRHREGHAGQINLDRANLVNRVGIDATQVAGGLDGGRFAGAVEDIEAQQLLLGLGKRAVDDRSGARAAQGDGPLRRPQPRRRPEPAS